MAVYRHVAITSLILIALGVFLRFHIIEAAEDLFAAKIQQQLDSQVAAVQFWAKTEMGLADSVATRHQVHTLLKRYQSASSEQMRKIQDELSLEVEQGLSSSDSMGFMILNQAGEIIASTKQHALGSMLSRANIRLIESVVERNVRLSSVMFADRLVPDTKLPPVMLIATRIEVDALPQDFYLVELLNASLEFNLITELYRSDERIEMYYFNAEGMMISESPLLNDVKRAGLLIDSERKSTVLNVRLTDPSSKEGLPVLPIQRALTLGSGSNFDGYRSYRNEEVMGVWFWVPELQIGFAVEVNRSEMLDLISPLLYTEILMFALLAFSGVAMVIYQVRMRRLDDQVNAFEQLGQYRLKEKIGEGGIGTVYRAKHALLRRPTALKVLKKSMLTEEIIDRFELEVQQTALLSHPNTIQVYDYGLSPDGTFYYAMEFIRGFNLGDYIEQFGPMPQARVIHILRQVCGSLAEAHSRGLIHRDIKPPNIMLCNQGGIYDHVKVLDFGLVKDISDPESTQLTQTQSIAGTPAYIAPERLQNPSLCDARTDIYALGAVAYNMLSGKDLFTGTNALQIALSALKESPVPISDAVSAPIEARLASLVMRCISKQPEQRPRDVFEILEELDRLQALYPWQQTDAFGWWSQYAEPLLKHEPEETEDA
ncbi:serine/threonine protein kinase [Corallincola platygyrae]